MRSTPSILTLSQAAKEQLRILLTQHNLAPKGIRLFIKTRGCSGYSYGLEYVDTLFPGDEAVPFEHGTLYIDPKAIMFLIGTIMDYETNPTQAGFTFKNPNEKGRCGCGESFHV